MPRPTAISSPMSATFPCRITALRELARSFGPDVARLSEAVLGNPDFAVWSACVGTKHHYGRGGLQEHTHEVVVLCLANRDLFVGGGHVVSARTLFLAALFHDIGKLRDYVPADETMDNWTAAPHKRTIHHISRSALMWAQAIRDTGCCADVEDEVLHAILAHHGQRAFGSPVFPKTREAWLLHLCDNLSARMDDCDRLDLAHET